MKKISLAIGVTFLLASLFIISIKNNNKSEEILERQQELYFNRSFTVDSFDLEEENVETDIEADNVDSYNDLMIVNDEGPVTIAASFFNSNEEDGDNWMFQLALDTHSVNLDQYDFDELISIKIDEELNIEEDLTIQKDGAGHHIVLNIYMPKIINGKNVFNENVEVVTIQAREIGEIPVREFHWEMKELKSF